MSNAISNAKVKSITTDAAGNVSATLGVDSPPPPDETYSSVPEALAKELRRAQDHDLRVDTTVNGSGGTATTTVHK